VSYLIDGNNVMAQRVGWHKNRALARRRLLDEIADFVRIKKVSVAVVFDGKPDDHFPDGSIYRGVKLFYAKRESNADERIKQLVEESRERRTLIVVTSDKTLSDYVRRCGADVMRSGEFRKRLSSIKSSIKDETKDDSKTNNTEENETVDDWMRYFGVAEDD
jgi:predicted RNA-binding protein with PIN domain